MARFPVVGPGYTLASVTEDCQECINWYPELDESKQGRAPAILKRAPGITEFSILPGSPIRGIWAGEDRLFCVAGAFFCEIFGDGSYNNRGAVGNDGLPCSIVANGNQVLITSAGQVYCDSGTGPVRVYFSGGSGTCDTNGTAVTSDSGSEFFALEANDYILIGGLIYQIAAVTDANDLVLTSSAGIQTQANWSGYGNNGTVSVFHDLSGSTAFVNWESGDQFPANMPGAQIVIAGQVYTVATQPTPTQVTITAGPGPIPPRGIAQYAASVPVPGFMATYMDTYFIVAQPFSKNFYISGNEDGTMWDAADTAQKEGYPDAIAAIKCDHEQLYILGDECSLEVWLDTGAALFPFQRNASQTIHWGCMANWSLTRFGDGIAWIGGDQERGGPFAMYAAGSSQVKISTAAVDAAWASYPVISDAVGFVKFEEGHEILFFTFPTANVCWCYDRTASMQLGIPCWHKRTSYNVLGTLQQDRNRAGCHAAVSLATVAASATGTGAAGSVNIVLNLGAGGIVPGQAVFGDGIVSGTRVAAIAGTALTLSLPTIAPLAATLLRFGSLQSLQSYVGDWSLGVVYASKSSMVTDNGAAITRLRTCPHVAGPDNYYTAFDRFELLIDLGPGVGLGGGVPPPVVPLLSYSKDGGHTYVNPQTRSVSPNQVDQWKCRFVWRRQGESRDRVYRLLMTDQTEFTVVDAYYEASPGNG